MKRLVLLATVLAFVLGAASLASAATVKATGQWALEFLWSNNFDMSDDSGDRGGNGDDGGRGDFNVYQRARTQFEFIANENLKGVLATEIGTARWGNTFRFHDHNATINTRRAYLDFMIPDTKVRVLGGLQGINLPTSFGGGSMIVDDEMPALVVTTPIIDEVSVLAGYGRLYDSDDTDTNHTNGSLDTGFLALPVKLDGFAFAPYFVYAYGGHNADGVMSANVLNGLRGPGAVDLTVGHNVYWAGTNFTMTYFDPIKVMADVAYGNVSASGGDDSQDRSGWLFDLAVDYTGFDFMTPEAFFVYSSGEDDDATNGSERMPALTARNWGIGNGLFYGGDLLLDGDHGFNNNQIGFWAVGLSLKDISFIDKLSHTLTAFYAQGTNDKAVAALAGATPSANDFISYGYTLTEEDHIIEFDLNNTYKLYDELSFMVNLGYDINGYDKDTWAGVDREDAFKLSTGLLYSF